MRTFQTLLPLYTYDTYFPIPFSVLFLYGLNAAIVYGDIYRRCITSGHTMVDPENFAIETKLSENKIKIAIRVLVKAGLIEKTDPTVGSLKAQTQFHKKINVYKVVPNKLKEIANTCGTNNCYKSFTYVK